MDLGAYLLVCSRQVRHGDMEGGGLSKAAEISDFIQSQYPTKKPVTSDDRWEGRDFAKLIRTSTDPLRPDDPSLGPEVTRVGPFYTYIPTTSLQKDSLKALLPFYTDKMLRSMLPFISQSGPIPLRDLEWAVTGKAREKPLMINGVDIFCDYTSKRRGNRKRNFEPYCKRIRWAFDIDGKTWYTSLGQLNFMKWALETGLIEYAIRNREEIVRHRDMVKARVREEAAQGLRPHRMALTKPPKSSTYVISGKFNNLDLISDEELREQNLEHICIERASSHKYESFDDAVIAAGFDPKTFFKPEKEPRQRAVRKRVRKTDEDTCVDQ
jgi:hypothetical protein